MEINKECYDYFNGDDLAASVFISKYAALINNKTEKTPDEMHHRLAKEYAKIENNHGGKYKLSENDIYELFKGFKYIIPGGSVMAGLGCNDYIGSLSNCFVVGEVKDTYASIMKYRDNVVQLEKRRGGVGIDISKLRPNGAQVNNAAKTSTGAVSFMEGFSNTSKEVAQNGRRGAMMISMNCAHPDIDDFIEIKQDLTKVTGANISVKFTDEFIKAVESDSDFLLRWPVDTNITQFGNAYQYPLNETVWISKSLCVKRVKAKNIWEHFIRCSWKTAEPGVMYLDRHYDYSPDSVYPTYKGVSTNPCGEIFMGPLDSCRLMNINLTSFVDNPYTKDAKIDYDKLQDVSRKCMRLCDDLVDLELEHVNKIIDHILSTYDEDNRNELELWKNIYEIGSNSRRAGCGATGLGDMIAMLGVNINSEEGLKIIDKVFHTKMAGELIESYTLSKERGTFGGYDFDKEFEIRTNDNGETVWVGRNKFFQFIADNMDKEILENIKKYGRRNVSFSTMAPTGSVSIMTQTTSGIEPLFSPYYKRRKKISNSTDKVDLIDANDEKFTEFFVLHQPFKNWIINFASNYDKSLSFDEQVTDEKLDAWFKESPWYGATASEISPKQHILMQAVVQKYTSHSISKTINLPETATEEETNELYLYGWHHGLKGLTIYRDNCREGILVKKDNKNCKCNQTLAHNAPKRPKILKCDIKRFKNDGEKWIACVGLFNNVPYEIFTGLEEKLHIPAYVTEGEIIKNKIDKEIVDEETGEIVVKRVSRYDIRYTDSKGEKITIDGLSSSFKDVYNNYSKLISGLCRHGMPLEYIVSTIKSLTFDNDNINSWKNGVTRAFKTYIADGEVKGEVCPECGAKIIRENGCKRCSECTWSACN
jgi:ribonucleoside-diphosphate reductase alpha chain